MGEEFEEFKEFKERSQESEFRSQACLMGKGLSVISHQ
jgi:hypothetical protein